MSETTEIRCTVCDTRLQVSDKFCRVCGTFVPAKTTTQAPAPKKQKTINYKRKAKDKTPSSKSKEVLSSKIKVVNYQWLMPAIIILGVIILSAILLREPYPEEVVIISPTTTTTPLPPTPTPTFTPLPTQTTPPTPNIPTVTPTPLPTATIQPPFTITIAAGDSLFALSLRNDVSPDSIAQVNNLSLENPLLQQGQALRIPYPTATPPLTAVEVQLGEEIRIADPTDCERYEIQNADTLGRIAAQFNVPLSALLIMNRLDVDSIVRPGDTVCIPTMRDPITISVPGLEGMPADERVILPTTLQLLYPPNQSQLNPQEGVSLQWLAFKDLADNERYMVEIVDLQDPYQHPHRSFTRQTSFQVPANWLPTNSPVHEIQWRVYLITVTGIRADGGFIYTYDERQSNKAIFNWQG